MQKQNKQIQNAVKGSLVGLMIGDALGMPAAGIKEEEYLRTYGPITSYRSNPIHPFFFYLKAGQWGSNVRLMLTALESWEASKGYNEADLRARLTELARKSKDDFIYARWLGETINKALLTGSPANSYSCTCMYRSIPLALLADTREQALEYSASQTKITHISDTSLAASHFLAYILYTLVHTDKDMLTVIKDALEDIKGTYNADILVRNIEQALSGEIKTIEKAREVFGTGSPAIEALPLSVYIIVTYGHNFAEAVLAGANSMRRDTPEETQRMAGLSYVMELLQCSGGATDVTAAIVGCILGARLGMEAMPQEFITDLEGIQSVEESVERLV